jgi:ElaB/YqjD/DUF883 family membrane-anchored ribosome-binding protein
MTPADITVLLAAALLLLAAYWRCRTLSRRTRNADIRCDHWRALVKTADQLAERLRTERDDAHASLEDMMARLTRIAEELETTERRGEKAAVAGMTILAKEREDFVESLQAWQGIAIAALLLPAPRALPAAPSPPELLPSGHALIAGDPDVLIHPDSDDLDVMSLPLPRRTS